jgi:hypothetical protein
VQLTAAPAGGVWTSLAEIVGGLWPAGSPSQVSEGKAAEPVATAAPVEPPRQQIELRELLLLARDAATALWRIRRRMLADAEAAGDVAKQRGLARHVDAAYDLFAQRGIEIRDPTGEKYVPGMNLGVLAFQPTPGLAHEKIIETIKPTILYHDQLLQRGDVIVGTPEAFE